ncbi:MAG TPA: histidine phosphatase family protein [Burkholderiales bacterium]|nr:histidine phosphatase family protein [Burkholderiales bacterium]
MELILWRHADAEDGAPDVERKLTAKGVKQARAMARWLKSRLPDDAVVMSSPARRARETAAALTDKFEIRNELGTDADCASLLTAAGWPKRDATVVVVGHQPTLGVTAAKLLAGAEQGWSVKKSAIWWIAARAEGGRLQAVLRAVISPDLL